MYFIFDMAYIFEVLILDEPTRNLSPISKPEIIEALKNYKGAIIAVSMIENLYTKFLIRFII